MVEFGPKHIETVKDALINELPQVRQKYDPEDIDELASSMVIASKDPGEEKTADGLFDMINPLLVGRHDRASARKYVRDYSDFNQLSSKHRVDASDFMWHQRSALVLIAGHRRRRAIGQLGERFDIPIENREIAADVRDNISFDEGLALQTRENIYSRPPAHDEARVIGQLYRYLRGQSVNHPPSIQHVASMLGYSETKVRDAIAFDSLPQAIQAYTVNGLLPYTTVKQLKPLLDAFASLYRDLPLEAKQINVTQELEIFCNQMVSMQLSGNMEKRRAQLIENRCQEVRGKAEYQQLELFFLERVPLAERKRSSNGQLTDLAIKVLKHRLYANQIDPTELDGIDQLVAEAKAIARSREVSQLDFEQSRT